MRDDSRVDILLICATVIASAAALRTALWPGTDDPNWELRWRGLGPDHQDWLAAMTTSRAWLATLTDPEEIELAKGFSRRELRRRAYVDLVVTAFLVVAVALALAGVLPFSTWGLILGCYTLILAAGTRLRDWQIKGKVQVEQPARRSPAGRREGSAWRRDRGSGARSWPAPRRYRSCWSGGCRPRPVRKTIRASAPLRSSPSSLARFSSSFQRTQASALA